MFVSDAARRLRAIEQVIQLPPEGFSRVEELLAHLQVESNQPQPQVVLATQPEVVLATPSVPKALDWPHAPVHRISPFGTFFVTTGTFLKQHFFRDANRLDHLQAALLERAKRDGWQLEAWAIFSNHYHFVAHALERAVNLGVMLKELHRTTAIDINRLDQVEGRQVWHNFRETELTYETSYYARLAYTHTNAVKHGLVPAARLYPWCSASWLERTATRAQIEILSRIKTDTVQVYDEYEPIGD